MPTKKNQHFVPRALLRRWALANEEKIGSILLKNFEYIPSSPIKGQCSKDWMYGKDLSLENAFCIAETEASIAFKHFATCSRAPDAFDKLKFALCIYICFQEGRTEAAINAKIDRAINSWKLLKLDEKLSQGTDSMSYEQKMRACLKSTSAMVPFVFDLGMRILVPPKDTNFIISDNPCIKINQAQNFRGKQGLGWAESGLQVILPIDPNALVFLYDKAVYRIGTRKERSQFRIHISENDLAKLNALQVLSAANAVYLSPNCDLKNIQNIVKKYSPRRSPIYEIEKMIDNDSATIIHSSIRSKKIRLEFSFSSVLRDSGVIFNTSEIPLRDPELNRLHQAIFTSPYESHSDAIKLMIAKQLSNWKGI